MKTYTVIGPVVALSMGTLVLTPDQANLRAYALETLGDDRYGIKSRVEFKRGESFGYNQAIPKALAECLESEEDSDTPLEEMGQPQLLSLAISMGLKPNHNTGTKKLAEMIKAKQAEDSRAAEAKAARIAELEAKGDDISDEERAELEELTA